MAKLNVPAIRQTLQKVIKILSLIHRNKFQSRAIFQSKPFAFHPYNCVINIGKIVLIDKKRIPYRLIS